MILLLRSQNLLTMSKSATAIARPKVRFSEFSDNLQNKEDEQYKKVTQQTSGPRITSIISLKTPVKIVNSKKVNADNKDTSRSNCVTEISPHCNSAISESTQSASQSCKNVPIVKTAKILCNNTDNIKESDNISQIDKKYQGSILKNFKSNAKQKGKENKLSQIDKKHQGGVLKDYKSNMRQKGKENKLSQIDKKHQSDVPKDYKSKVQQKEKENKGMTQIWDTNLNNTKTSNQAVF